MDEVFNRNPIEWYDQQVISSAHDATTIEPYDMPGSYILFVYPRDATPVCTDELKSLQYYKDRSPLPIIAGSTDSPEVHNWFYNDPEVFKRDITYPVLTINPADLTEKGIDLLLNAYGYCKRVAIIVVEDKVRAVYEMDNDTPRDVSILLTLARNITGK